MQESFTNSNRTVPEGISQVVVDGTIYEISRMPTTKSLKMLTRLLKLIGEPIGTLVKGIKVAPGKSILDADFNFDFAGEAVNALASNLEEDVVAKTLVELAECARVNGMTVQFEVHYKGRILHLTKVVAEVLKLNYEDFFAGLSASGLGARLKGRTMSPTVPTSNGASGALS